MNYKDILEALKKRGAVTITVDSALTSEDVSCIDYPPDSFFTSASAFSIISFSVSA